MAWESMTTEPVESVTQKGVLSVAKCKFCDFTAEFRHEPDARREVYVHAKNNHYDYASDCFMNDEDRSLRRRHREEYRNIMGGPEETANMNRMGL